MPFLYEIDSERRLVTIRLSGYVNMETILAAAETIGRDKRWDDTMNRIWDATDVRSLAMSPEEFSMLRSMMEHRLRENNRTAVVYSTDRDEALAMLFMAYAGRETFRIFRSHAEAVAWLGEGTKEE